MWSKDRHKVGRFRGSRMSEVMVGTETTYMDRVRSRIASLPGYRLEDLLPGIERSKDVEQLDELFDPERRADFLASVASNATNVDPALLDRIPIWADRFIALHLEVDDPIPAYAMLEIADEYVRYIAFELGLTSGRALLTDCVIGSVTFKIDLGLDRINITNAVAASLIFWGVQSLIQGIVNNKEHPQLVEFHQCAAKNMEDYQIKEIVFYTNDGVMVSCKQKAVIENARKIPAPDYSAQDARREPIRDYTAKNESIIVEGSFDDEHPPKFRVTKPENAARQMGIIATSMSAELAQKAKPDTVYRVEGYWRELGKKTPCVHDPGFIRSPSRHHLQRGRDERKMAGRHARSDWEIRGAGRRFHAPLAITREPPAPPLSGRHAP